LEKNKKYFIPYLLNIGNSTLETEVMGMAEITYFPLDVQINQKFTLMIIDRKKLQINRSENFLQH